MIAYNHSHRERETGTGTIFSWARSLFGFATQSNYIVVFILYLHKSISIAFPSYSSAV